MKKRQGGGHQSYANDSEGDNQDLEELMIDRRQKRPVPNRFKGSQSQGGASDNVRSMKALGYAMGSPGKISIKDQ